MKGEGSKNAGLANIIYEWSLTTLNLPHRLMHQHKLVIVNLVLLVLFRQKNEQAISNTNIYSLIRSVGI